MEKEYVLSEVEADTAAMEELAMLDDDVAAMANYMRQRFGLEAMDMKSLGQLMCLIQVPEN